MSTDWHVHCKDCNSTHTFNDANHQDSLMHGLVRHKRLIASLLPLLTDKDIISDIEFKTYYGSIDVAWFAEHVEHNLVVQNEYGDIREVSCDLCKQVKDVRRVSLGSPASTVGFYCEDCNNRIKNIVRAL